MFKSLGVLLVLATTILNPLYSVSTTSQTIVISLEPITEFVIKGADPVMNVPVGPSVAIKGKVTQFYSGLSYSYSCSDGCTKKIIAQLDRDTPDGFDINVYLAAPQGAVTNGYQTLSTVEADLVHDINGNSNVYNAQLIYEIVVDESFSSLSTYERKVIYTFLDQ